ncbi:unnamed protein product [Effrenium voratum]|nr:unnamed protein product [Effrenium voratum]
MARRRMECAVVLLGLLGLHLQNAFIAPFRATGAQVSASPLASKVQSPKVPSPTAFPTAAVALLCCAAAARSALSNSKRASKPRARCVLSAQGAVSLQDYASIPPVSEEPIFAELISMDADELTSMEMTPAPNAPAVTLESHAPKSSRNGQNFRQARTELQVGCDGHEQGQEQDPERHPRHLLGPLRSHGPRGQDATGEHCACGRRNTQCAS